MRKKLLLYLLCCCVFPALSQNLLPVKVNNQWGFINPQGAVVVPCEYDFVGTFGKDGLAVASYKNVLTVIDTLGQRKTPDYAEDIRLLGNQLFLIRINGRWGVSNFRKEFPVPAIYSNLIALSSSLLAALDSSGSWGMISLKNKALIPFKYRQIRLGGTGLIEAEKTGDTDVYNERGVLLYSSSDKNSMLVEGRFVLRQLGAMWGIRDTSGKMLVSNQWPKVEMISSGLIRLSSTKKAILFSVFHGTVIAPNLKEVSSVRENTFLFVNDTLKGLADIMGKVIVPAEFKNFTFNDGFIRSVYRDETWVLYTSAGLRILPGSYDELSVIPPLSLIMVRQNTAWGLWNMEGKQIQEITADTIMVQDSIVKIYKGEKCRKIIVNSFGQVTEEEEFKVSLFRVRRQLNYTSAYRPVNTANLPGLDQLNRVSTTGDTVYNGNWFYVKKRMQWGLIDNKGKVKITPVFTNIIINDSLGYTIVFSAYWMPNNFFVDKYGYNPQVTIGIYDHVHFRYLLEPQYTSLRYMDFRQGEFARCIPNFIGDEISLVNLKGEVVRKKFTYIAPFQEGLARCLVGGTLGTTPQKNKNTFITIGDYFRDLEGRDRISGGQVFIENNEGKWGYVNRSAEMQVAAQYTTAEDFSENVAVVSINYRYGLINNKGATIIPMQYDGVERMKNGGDSLFLVSLSSEKWGILNENGRAETNALYDDISAEGWGKYYICRRGQYEVILDENYNPVFEDTSKKIVYIDSTAFLLVYDEEYHHFDAANGNRQIIAGDKVEVLDGYLVIQKAKHYFICDAYLKELDISKYAVSKIYPEGYVFYATDKYSNKTYGIKSFASGDRQKLKYDEVGEFTKGRATFRQGFLYGIMQMDGKEILKPKYDYIGNEEEGYRVFRSFTSWGALSEGGRVVLQPRYSSVWVEDDNRFIVGKNNKYNVADEKGDTLFKTWFDKVDYFHHGLTVVKNDKEYFLADDKGNIQSKAYPHLSYLSNRLYLSSDVSGSVVLNEAGDTISILLGVQHFDFNKNTGIVYNGEKKGLSNIYGAKVVPPKYSDLVYLGMGKYKYKIKEFYKVYDLSGNIVVTIPAEGIELVYPGLFRIEAENKIGYLKRSGIWLWPLTF
ncbi:MAG: WG repeat-containing protein [Flavobacteriales bacterium]